MASAARDPARAKIGVFLALVVVFAAALAVINARVPHGATLLPVPSTQRLVDALQMWSVGLAGLIALALIDGNWRDIGWKLAPTRYFVFALAAPVIYWAVIYVPIWLLAPATFRGAEAMRANSSAAILHFPWSLLLAAGEELGWRGVLVPNLARKTDYLGTVIVSGGLWAVWHYPDMILFGYHAGTPLPYAMACFTLALLGLAACLAWLRLRSQSIWPAVLFHATHNSAIWGICERTTVHSGATLYLATEFGAGLAAVSIVLAMILAAYAPLPGWGVRLQFAPHGVRLRRGRLKDAARVRPTSATSDAVPKK
jgi:membrane protease YdiL (CAAX protease family)